MNIERIRNIFINHKTHDTAISRNHLAVELMTSDRNARETIERARAVGLPIVSSSRQSGYWWNREDYENIYLPECRARAKAERMKEQAYFSNDPNQITLDEVV